MSYSQYRRPNTYSSSQHSKRPQSGGRQPKKEYIHPSRFIQSAKTTSSDEPVITSKFSDFTITPLIKQNLTQKGFDVTTPIQDQTIPIGLLGKDVVGIANTGTGKTAAFAVPILHQLITGEKKSALIMAPTRELAQQIEEECRSIAKSSGLNGALLIGGVSMGPQLRDLRFKPQIVIGTPGRIKDHLEQQTLNLSNFDIIVLDEVDRMLDMGFINDIRFILNKTAQTKQSFFFSATLDERVKTIIQQFSTDPVHVVVKTGETSDNVDQNIITYAGKNEKINKLHELLIRESVVKALVFDDTHRSVEKLCKELQLRGFETDAIHGGKSQSKRQKALDRFKDSKINVLVATDVAARGIDVVDITHVVNYSAPQSYGDYVHRIGRTGRAGRIGHALTFVET
ncbi:MAG TPA: DEAD/DEAH box helicase [Candidatus Saccharimonadales bacterium]|nr:DEAD/DEAH box helicase [Candidatus Saccharimonadales bacterium]